MSHIAKSLVIWLNTRSRLNFAHDKKGTIGGKTMEGFNAHGGASELSPGVRERVATDMSEQEV